MTYFRMEEPHYHWRGAVSLSCSGWEGVGPTRYGRQTNCSASSGELLFAMFVVTCAPGGLSGPAPCPPGTGRADATRVQAQVPWRGVIPGRLALSFRPAAWLRGRRSSEPRVVRSLVMRQLHVGVR